MHVPTHFLKPGNETESVSKRRYDNYKMSTGVSMVYWVRYPPHNRKVSEFEPSQNHGGDVPRQNSYVNIASSLSLSDKTNQAVNITPITNI